MLHTGYILQIRAAEVSEGLPVIFRVVAHQLVVTTRQLVITGMDRGHAIKRVHNRLRLLHHSLGNGDSIYYRIIIILLMLLTANIVSIKTPPNGLNPCYHSLNRSQYILYQHWAAEAGNDLTLNVMFQSYLN